ncbi:permease-like cell division protein FtsX [Patescibacteria group bacterium]|nr:permease-like cell division protein FtsX [Patescibacteria group bacterium]
MIRTAWRIYTASIRNIWRNGWISLATIFVFALALFSVNVLLGVQSIVGSVARSLEERVDITITFKSDAPTELVSQARFFLRSLPQVKDLQEISPDQALAEFKELHKNDPNVLEALNEVGGNPLGAKLVVKARHPDEYPFLIQAVQNPQYQPYIERQTYDRHEGAIALVEKAGRNVRLFASALIALFACFGLLMAFNAIRVAIYTQREEIAIMRLVGASNTYIRGPFVLEGIWLALIAFALSSALTYVLVVWSEPWLFRALGVDGGLRAFFQDRFWPIVLIEAGVLVLLAMLSSGLAAGRYSKR